MEPRQAYSTDLSDKEWELIKHLVPEAKPGGRPEKYPKREILNGIFYIVRGGCAWRLMPHDLPPWQMVYQYFWRWRRDNTWQRRHDLLRGDLRVAALFSVVVDSQSASIPVNFGLFWVIFFCAISSLLSSSS